MMRDRSPAALRRALVAVLFMAALAACASGPPRQQIGLPPGMPATPIPSGNPPPTFEGRAPSGFVVMHEVQVAYLGSAGGGTGTLTVHEQSYPFDVGGLGVGGIGVSTIDAEGEVYNLTDVAQFAGAYAEGRYGAVLGTESTGDLWLENEQGVVMHLKAKREGLMLSVGADAIDIRMSL